MICHFKVYFKHRDKLLHETDILSPVPQDFSNWMDGFVIGAAKALKVDASEIAVEFRPVRARHETEIFEMGKGAVFETLPHDHKYKEEG